MSTKATEIIYQATRDLDRRVLDANNQINKLFDICYDENLSRPEDDKLPDDIIKWVLIVKSSIENL